jgi:hypothetical protein
LVNAAFGYLPEEVYGYALAKFAVERREDKPKGSSIFPRM